MLAHGFLRVAAAVPKVRLADCDENANHVIQLLERAEAEQAAVVVFPELCLTGYTCGDLFHQSALLNNAWFALRRIVKFTKQGFSGLAIVGLPVRHDGRLYNCAAAIHRGELLALVPKQYLPNYQEFYEDRWFHSGSSLIDTKTTGFEGSQVPLRPGVLFEVDFSPKFSIGVEICEDLWVPIPPSCQLALSGALVLLNLSASNEVIGKAQYRRQLVQSQSGRCIAAYVYCSSGVDESTTDLVFGGHCLIAENGNLIAESARFCRGDTLLVADVDIDRLLIDRLRTGTFHDYRDPKPILPPPIIPIVLGSPRTSQIGFSPGTRSSETRLLRPVDPHPFVPKGAERLRERCEEIFQIQVAGLARRLEHVDAKQVTIGVSGGLDSTLALLVTCRTFDTLGWPRAGIHAWTMPGFGTTARTLNNARRLMTELGVTPHEADIRALCLEELRLLGHQPFGISLDGLDVESFTERLRRIAPEKRHDLIFENVQARMRTNLLMNAGFVVGTGDLSELALGWCTYNADHMSMYNPNVSIPKTLVRFLVEWAARHQFDDPLRQTLLDIVATVISPELLPTDASGEATQATESAIGPYELHDFFLFHFLRYGATPEKILFLASQTTFDRPYTKDEIRHWLRVFLTRFFANQFKRSCLPDGPKVGSVSLSPRGDWRMPSDACVRQWLDALDEETNDVD